MYDCVCACVCGLDCVGALGLCLNRPASFHPNPLSMISPTTQTATRENTGIKTDLAGFDNECTEIHRLSSLVALQLYNLLFSKV